MAINGSAASHPLVLAVNTKSRMYLLNHHVPGLDYLKAGWLRSPLDLSLTFVSEQAIDDLAFQLQQDPLNIRRTNISDGIGWEYSKRSTAANWEHRAAAQNPGTSEIVPAAALGSARTWRRGVVLWRNRSNKRTGKVE